MNTINVGSIRINVAVDGNITIYLSHTPSNSMHVERADVDDLRVAVGRAQNKWNDMQVERLVEENRKLNRELKGRS